MKKLLQPLKNNSGDSNYISATLAIFFILVVILFFIKFAAVFKVNNDLSNAADKLIRSAELSGQTDLNAQADMLRKETGLNFSLSWVGTNYIPGTNKVQLNSDIHLSLSTKYTIQLYKFPIYDVTLNVRRTGTSEIYYK